MDNKLILSINLHNNTLQRLFQKNYPKIKTIIRNNSFNAKNNAADYKKKTLSEYIFIEKRDNFFE